MCRKHLYDVYEQQINNVYIFPAKICCNSLQITIIRSGDETSYVL